MNLRFYPDAVEEIAQAIEYYDGWEVTCAT